MILSFEIFTKECIFLSVNIVEYGIEFLQFQAKMTVLDSYRKHRNAEEGAQDLEGGLEAITCGFVEFPPFSFIY